MFNNFPCYYLNIHSKCCEKMCSRFNKVFFLNLLLICQKGDKPFSNVGRKWFLFLFLKLLITYCIINVNKQQIFLDVKNRSKPWTISAMVNYIADAVEWVFSFEVWIIFSYIFSSCCHTPFTINTILQLACLRNKPPAN